MAIILLSHGRRRVGRLLKHDSVFGRDSGCDFVLDVHGVSRTHACIRRHRGEYIIEDLDSSNGTFINGFRIGNPQILLPEDEIQIGAARLTFLEDLELPEDATRWPRKGVRIRSLRFKCPCCEVTLKAPTNRIGKRVRCVKCRNTLIVPRHEGGHVRILESAGV